MTLNSQSLTLGLHASHSGCLSQWRWQLLFLLPMLTDLLLLLVLLHFINNCSESSCNFIINFCFGCLEFFDDNLHCSMQWVHLLLHLVLLSLDLLLLLSHCSCNHFLDAFLHGFNGAGDGSGNCFFDCLFHHSLNLRHDVVFDGFHVDQNGAAGQWCSGGCICHCGRFAIVGLGLFWSRCGSNSREIISVALVLLMHLSLFWMQNGSSMFCHVGCGTGVRFSVLWILELVFEDGKAAAHACHAAWFVLMLRKLASFDNRDVCCIKSAGHAFQIFSKLLSHHSHPMFRQFTDVTMRCFLESLVSSIDWHHSWFIRMSQTAVIMLVLPSRISVHKACLVRPWITIIFMVSRCLFCFWISCHTAVLLIECCKPGEHCSDFIKFFILGSMGQEFAEEVHLFGEHLMWRHSVQATLSSIHIKMLPILCLNLGAFSLKSSPANAICSACLLFFIKGNGFLIGHARNQHCWIFSSGCFSAVQIATTFSAQQTVGSDSTQKTAGSSSAQKTAGSSQQKELSTACCRFSTENCHLSTENCHLSTENCWIN